MSELKPCPCCGGDPIITQEGNLSRPNYIECSECGVSTEGYVDIELGVEIWNRRTPWLPDELVEELRSEVEFQQYARTDSLPFRILSALEPKQ